jgi:hypothetical protein
MIHLKKPPLLRVFLFVGLLFGSGFTANAADFSERDNRTTALWILVALDRDHSKPQNNLETLLSLVSKPAPVESVEAAFQRLKICQVSGGSEGEVSFPLVAAQHHLFMRRLASREGDSNLTDLPQDFYETKLRLAKAGKLNRLRLSDQPVSPANEGALAWAELGVLLGLQEYGIRTRQHPEPKLVAKQMSDRLSMAESSSLFSWALRKLDLSRFAGVSEAGCVFKKPMVK